MLLLVFCLGDDRYAIETGRVVEVIPQVTLRKLPHAPDCVAGLFNYRGGVVPVIDLCALTQGQPCRPSLSTRIVLVRYTRPGDAVERVLGLMAERVTETLKASEGDLVSSGVSVERAPYLGKILMDADGMVQILAVERLLSHGLCDELFAEPVEQT